MDEQKIYGVTFPIGPTLPAADPRAHFVVAVAAAANDLRFIFQLYDARDDLADKGETQYLVRASAAHLLELSLVLAQASHVEVLGAMVQGFDDDRKEDFATVLAAGNGASAFSRVLWHVRNKVTFHYPKVGDKHLRRTLAEIADWEGSLEVGETHAVGRAVFADVVLSQFWLHNLEVDDELQGLGDFYRQLADATGAALRVSDEVVGRYVMRDD